MTDREFFVATLREEKPKFEKVFRALPEDQLEYKSHPANRTAGSILKGCVSSTSTWEPLLKTGLISEFPMPEGSLADLVSAFSANAERAAELASAMSEAEWNSEAKLVMDGQELWKTTRGAMAWSWLFDLIHHRGQLSVYLRPMGGKVPAIYGPSADEPMAE